MIFCSRSRAPTGTRSADRPFQAAAVGARRRRPLASALAFGVLAASLGASAVPAQQLQETPQSLPTIRLNAGIHNIEAEVARTPDEHGIGLMFRRQMPVNHGMLFIFEPPPQVHCFWMRNTLLPLSIAFLADDGTVVNIADMKPQTTDSHCPLAPVRYALEMNQGWFAKRGIGRGSKLTGAPFGTP